MAGKKIEIYENTKTPKTRLRDRCGRSWDHVRPWHAREYPQCGLQSPEKHMGDCRLWHRRLLSGHTRIVTKTSWISTCWWKDLSTHQPSATVDSLDGDHEARRERAGQERGGVEADDVVGVKGVQAEACACTDRVDDVCSSCHCRLFGI